MLTALGRRLAVRAFRHIRAIAGVLRSRQSAGYKARGIRAAREADQRSDQRKLKESRNDHQVSAVRFRRRLTGQRMISSAVPASPSSNPPIAKPSSHQVLKSSWFFQSMMWRLQKKS